MKIHDHIKNNIKVKEKNNNNNYNRWQWIIMVGEEKKNGNVTSGKGDILMWEK